MTDSPSPNAAEMERILKVNAASKRAMERLAAIVNLGSREFKANPGHDYIHRDTVMAMIPGLRDTIYELTQAARAIEVTAPLCDERSSEGSARLADAERAAWLADKIVAHGDYAKEAASMLLRWPSTAPQLSSLSLEGEREAFEEAYRKAYPVTCENAPNKFDHAFGSYFDTTVLVAWRLWQARAAMKPQS